MDGLALFCNLCADGPVTLRRLRAEGVRDLGQLATLEPATLARWLRCSLPQAGAFAEEARKLARRLGETSRRVGAPVAQPTPAVATAEVVTPAPSNPPPASVPAGATLRSPAPARDTRLVPGLLAGLDSHACTRLAEHGVRTTRALAESAGLALARRSGVPYSALLSLAREARRHLAGARVPKAEAGASTALPVRELVPFRTPTPVRVPQPAPVAELAAAEAPLAEAFTLPLVEPGSAGPFG